MDIGKGNIYNYRRVEGIFFYCFSKSFVGFFIERVLLVDLSFRYF